MKTLTLRKEIELVVERDLLLREAQRLIMMGQIELACGQMSKANAITNKLEGATRENIDRSGEVGRLALFD
jgi:hypothetical protein